jgi:hypothetical protein
MTVPATTHAGRGAWLVLAYRLPTGHGLKTAIRRRLTAIGAVFPANAVAALPASPAAQLDPSAPEPKYLGVPEEETTHGPWV